MSISDNPAFETLHCIYTACALSQSQFNQPNLSTMEKMTGACNAATHQCVQCINMYYVLCQRGNVWSLHEPSPSLWTCGSCQPLGPSLGLLGRTSRWCSEYSHLHEVYRMHFFFKRDIPSKQFYNYFQGYVVKVI